METVKWKKADEKQSATQLILGRKSISLRLEDAFELYNKKVKEGFPRGIHRDHEVVLTRFFKNRNVNSVTVGELAKLVAVLSKERADVTHAYSIRSYFSGVVRAINDIPVQKILRNAPKPGENIAHDGPRKFRLKLFDLSELPSLGIGKSPSKHESFVNEVINSLLDISPGKSYLIEPLKGDVLTVKEIRGYKMHTNKTFKKRKMNWQLGYSESHKCFAVFPAEQPTPKGATNHAK